MNAAADTVVKLVGVSRLYRQGASVVHALQHINLEIRKGDFAVLVGPSGSGKTTLLNVIGGLDSPTEGHVWVDGSERSGHWVKPRFRTSACARSASSSRSSI